MKNSCLSFIHKIHSSIQFNSHTTIIIHDINNIIHFTNFIIIHVVYFMHVFILKFQTPEAKYLYLFSLLLFYSTIINIIPIGFTCLPAKDLYK